MNVGDDGNVTISAWMNFNGVSNGSCKYGDKFKHKLVLTNYDNSALQLVNSG